MSLTLYDLIKFCLCLVLLLFWESTFEEQLPVEKKIRRKFNKIVHPARLHHKKNQREAGSLIL